MANSDILQAAIDNYLDQLASQAREQEKIPAAGVSPRPAVNIDDFFSLVQGVIARQEQNEGVSQGVAFTEDFPEIEDNFSKEIITFSLEERRPGVFAQVKIDQIFSSRQPRQRQRFFRESKPDPDFIGGKIYIYGQWYDNLVEFKIWAKTNKAANRRALWLEDLFDKWEWYFEAEGVSKLFYLGRLADEIAAPGNNKTVCRTLQYYIRTERLTIVREQILRNIVVAGQNS